MLTDEVLKVEIMATETENPNSLLLEDKEESVAETEETEGQGDELPIEEITIGETGETDTTEETGETGATEENSEMGAAEEVASQEGEIVSEVQQQQQQSSSASHLFIMSGLLLAALFLVFVFVVWKKKKMKKKIILNGEPRTVSPMKTLGRKTIKVMETSEACPVKVASVHDVGRRSMQQDSFGVSDLEGEEFEQKGVMAIVADGMGGLSDGERMSQLVVISMLQGFDEDAGQMPAASLLLKLVNDANEAVNDELGEDKIGKCGSTLTGVIVKENKLSWISVGDSHIYVYRSGKLFKMNKDHNYAAELDEKVVRGELSLDEAMTDPQRAALTSFIGMGQLELVDQNENPVALESGDRILLMSDGVFGTVEEKKITQFMGLPLEESCKKLEEEIHVKNKGNQDNFTCVILELK